MKRRLGRIWSKADLEKAKQRMKARRSARLPTADDLPEIEREARKEMRRLEGELGVG
jgi:hypothetical protein